MCNFQYKVLVAVKSCLSKLKLQYCGPVIVKKEILETTPIDPFEADLLHMAEAVATAEKDESSNHAITCDENVKDTDMDTFSSHGRRNNYYNNNK